jgi:hypothetical protein
MSLTFEECHLALLVPPRGLKCRVRRAETGAKEGLLVVSFAGDYGVGAAGNEFGEFMSEAVMTGVATWQPKALILDFLRLRYSWGDMIEAVLPGDGGEWGPPCVTCAVVVGVGCREGIRTLWFGENAEDSLSELPWVHESLGDAAEYVLERLVAAQQNNASAEARKEGAQ